MAGTLPSPLERRRLEAAVAELEMRGATEVTGEMRGRADFLQVHIRAATCKGEKRCKRLLPRPLLTKMLRLRLQTEVLPDQPCS